MEKKEKRFELPIAQKAIIYDKTTKKFLVLKAKNPTDFFKKHYGLWEFPGGKLEQNESLLQGVEREIKEEVGDINYDYDCALNTRIAEFSFGKMLMIDHLAFYKEGEIRLSDEHEEYKWEAALDIEKNDGYGKWLKELVKKAGERIREKDYFDSWRRCVADFENYKKRQKENAKDMVAFSNMNMVLQILPVLDNFHASTGHIPEDQKENPWVTGIMHIQKQLVKVLEDNGVSEIVTREGDKFDPEIHEAIHQESEESKQETIKLKNIVKKVLVKGYGMGDRVIRAAKVIVG